MFVVLTMHREHYNLITSRDRIEFQFNSKGPNGMIKKGVIYTLHKVSGLTYYNLAFGDLDEETGDINDFSISNNNDRDKILATVAITILKFTESFPDALIYAKGSTPSRTRLYQMSIGLNYDEVSEYLKVYGLQKDRWNSFEKNVNYEAFIVLRK